MRIRTAEGFYEQSYYAIYIDSDEEFDVVIDSNNQTFVHEYIHFLQDIFLPYNLRFNMVAARDFELIVAKAQTGFGRPFEDWDEDSKVTQTQLRYTFGDNASVDDERDISEIETKHTILPPHPARIFQYDLILDIFGLYQIGARDLLEYIAYKIESKHWETDAPYFPYRTVDKIIDFKNMSMICDQNRIAIAELALHNDNPIHQFLFLLDTLRAECDNETLTSYDKLKGILGNFAWTSVGGTGDSMHSKTERRLKGIRDSLQNLYPQKYFPDIYAWIVDIEGYVKANMQGRFFFAELYALDRNAFFSSISNIVAEIGVPLVFNSREQVFSLLPAKYDQQQFMQMYLNNKFMEFSTSTEAKCTLYDFCSAGDSSIMDHNCTGDPIARVSYEELCPMGQMVKRLNLHKIK